MPTLYIYFVKNKPTAHQFMKSTKQKKEPKVALYSELDEADRFLHDCLAERETRTMFIKHQLSSGWTKQKVLNLLRGLGFNY